MTKDQFEEWVTQSGLDLCPGWVMSGKARENLERFAQLVAEAEMEECAKVCEAEHLEDPQDREDDAYDSAVYDCAAAIRQRGKP